MKSDYIIGEKSLMTNYSYNTSIDSQTCNSIKLVRPNKETGKSDVFIRKDSDTIARWGLLQLYQKVDEAATDAQVKEQAKVSLEYYNRVLQQLKFTSLGVNSRGRDSFFWTISMILTATRSASMSCWKRSLIRGKTICTPWNWKQKLCKGGKSFGHRGSTFAAEPGCRRR